MEQSKGLELLIERKGLMRQMPLIKDSSKKAEMQTQVDQLLEESQKYEITVDDLYVLSVN